VDAELCEQFTLLPFDQQVSLAQEMDRTPVEISRKLEEIRAIL
jgi:splicing factor 3B subunit 3